MRPSLKALRSRASSRARHAAEGGGPPVGQEPPRPEERANPGAIERGTIRRRLRRARRLRESLLTELGALVMEMHRQRREDPALVERKAREALIADREAAGLARALGAEQTVQEVVAAGIAGGCHHCGALLAIEDHFCARCGAQTVVALAGAASAAPAAASAPPDPGTRPAAPPDPAARVPTPAPSEPAAAPPPPPDPGTRVPAPDADATVQIATGTPRQ